MDITANLVYGIYLSYKDLEPLARTQIAEEEGLYGALEDYIFRNEHEDLYSKIILAELWEDECFIIYLNKYSYTQDWFSGDVFIPIDPRELAVTSRDRLEFIRFLQNKKLLKDPNPHWILWSKYWN